MEVTSKYRKPDITSEKIGWCITKHEDTNHFYDKYLPYEFHLRMVEQIHQDFKHLLVKNPILSNHEVYRNMWENEMILNSIITIACYGHDLIEDTRCSYSDVKQHLGEEVAEIVYALTNEKGRYREDRGNDKYYEGIRATKGAVFVKLCDRIANVQYSKMTKSSMFDKYKKENDKFLERMGFNGLDSHPYWDMFSYLIDLLR